MTGVDLTHVTLADVLAGDVTRAMFVSYNGTLCLVNILRLEYSKDFGTEFWFGWLNLMDFEPEVG